VVVTPECAGAGCHAGTNLIPIHDDGTCATCHTSTDTRVINAIATGNKDCLACHDHAGDEHILVHLGDVPPSCAGEGCHSGDPYGLLSVHTLDFVVTTCDMCHKSTDPNVIQAIADGNHDCIACHPTVDHAAGHEVVLGAATELIMSNHEDWGDVYWLLQCEWCHQSNLVTEHNDKCAVCHESTDPNVVNAIATSNTDCAACHPTRHGNADAAHTAIVKAFQCIECHYGNDFAVSVEACVACHDTLPMGP